MSMVKFSSEVFRVLNEKNDWENEKNDSGKCLGLPHTGYGPGNDQFSTWVTFVMNILYLFYFNIFN